MKWYSGREILSYNIYMPISNNIYIRNEHTHTESPTILRNTCFNIKCVFQIAVKPVTLKQHYPPMDFALSLSLSLSLTFALCPFIPIFLKMEIMDTDQTDCDVSGKQTKVIFDASFLVSILLKKKN